MITGKRFLSVCLCILMCVCALVSCSDGVSKDALSQLEALSGGYDEVYESHRIVIPASCGEVLAQSARTLAKEISTQTGSSCAVVFDNDEIGASESCFDILLGYTDREQTQSAFYGLKRDDYICKVADGALMLGGKCDSATANAVEKYIDEVLPLCDPTKITYDGCGFEYRGEYDVNELILCGFELDRYTFVCADEKSSSTYELTCMLREKVADRSGYYPKIVCSKARTEGKREIVLDASASLPETSVIRFDGEDILLSSDTVYGLSVASEKLYGILFSDVTDGNASCNITCDMTYVYSSAYLDITAMITDIPVDVSGISTASALASRLNALDSDVIALNSFNADIWQIVESELSEKYKILKQTLDNGEILPLLVDLSDVSVTLEQYSVKDPALESIFYLEHKNSGQIFELYSFFGGGGETNADLIKDALQSAENSAVAVFLSKDSSAVAFDVIGDGISTECNAAVTVVTSERRCGIFTTSDFVDCSESNIIYSELADVCFIPVRAQKKFCDGFLSLNQSEDI